MNEDNVKASSDLIRWLKLLALPSWAKAAIASIMLFTLANALYLLVDGMITRDKDAIASGLTILTTVLPVGLIVVVLVFGDGGSRKLKELTLKVLRDDIPSALQENFIARPFGPGNWTPRLESLVNGCAGNYHVLAPASDGGKEILHFVVELNVQKINLVLLIPGRLELEQASDYFKRSATLQSCLTGARNEGYALNEAPEHRGGMTGLVLTRTLHEDFLLDPAKRLYFAQDLAFFIRGMIEAHRD